RLPHRAGPAGSGLRARLDADLCDAPARGARRLARGAHPAEVRPVGGAAVGASSARRTRAALLLVPFAVGAAWALVLAQPAAGPSPLEPAAWRRAWTFLSRLLG